MSATYHHVNYRIGSLRDFSTEYCLNQDAGITGGMLSGARNHAR
ncbi:hypothetical protein [Pectobacterium atrosepticum]|nr:hypothetical protein [Pectobacterium atrosepticum]